MLCNAWKKPINTNNDTTNNKEITVYVHIYIGLRVQNMNRTRIHKEIKVFAAEKPDYVSRMHVDERNMNHVHFLVHGPPDTPFEGGQYVVALILPRDYPMKPPRVQFKTPNGRFQLNTDICASFTSYHPETWSPIHNFCTILRSLISFMTDRDAQPFVGRMDTSDVERKMFATESIAYNVSHGLNNYFK